MPNEVAGAGLATLAMTQGISAFSMFLPRITEVRRITNNDPQGVADVRTAEAAGLVVCLAVGAVCSALVRSPAPAIVSLVTALIIVALYESVLHADPNSSNGSNVISLIKR